MNIELKNVKVHNDMSQETTCFSASVWLDGKRVGIVQNNGCGGCNDYAWQDRDAGRRINEFAVEKLSPEVKFEHLDMLIAGMLDDFEERKTLKRWCRQHTVLKFSDYKRGEWYKMRARYTPALAASLREKYGAKLVRIANEEV